MIKHISLYKLKDKNNIESYVERLKKMDACDLIIKNNVYTAYDKNLPNIDRPIFMDVMHEAYFNNEEDARLYPTSKEHLDLVKETNDLLEYVVSFDYIEGK